ncbi:MAG: hypothetical protein J5825_05080 [Lachnospiraceae bacterium]|nr:hypothetical protein [Lachnospiraceae bacterium]
MAYLKNQPIVIHARAKSVFAQLEYESRRNLSRVPAYLNLKNGDISREKVNDDYVLFHEFVTESDSLVLNTLKYIKKNKIMKATFEQKTGVTFPLFSMPEISREALVDFLEKDMPHVRQTFLPDISPSALDKMLKEAADKLSNEMGIKVRVS